MRLNTTFAIALASGSLIAGSLALPAVADPDPTPTADPNTIITFLAELPHAKQALERAATAISDPASDSFRDYLSVAQAAREFGASDAQIRKVRQAARQLGLSAAIDPTRLITRISGPVSAWEKAMGTQITYQPSQPGNPYDNFSFPGPDVPPPAADDPDFWAKQFQAQGNATLGAPAALATAVTRFVAQYSQYVPADDVPTQSTMSATTEGQRDGRSIYFPGYTEQTPPTNPAAGLMDSCVLDPTAPVEVSKRTGERLAPDVFLGANQVFDLYGITGMQRQAGAAATNRVTILSLGGGYSDQDLGLAAECFRFTKPDVRITLGTGVPSPIVSVDGETNLDVQTVSMTLKNATSVHLVQASGDLSFDATMVDGYTRALTSTPRPHAITLSYGACEPLLAPFGMFPTLESVFKFAAVIGTTIMVSAGDGGSSVCQEQAAEQLMPVLDQLRQAEQELQQSSNDGDSTQMQQTRQVIAELQEQVATLLPVAAYVRPTVSYPASSPWAVAIGGSQILLNPDGTRAGEIPWNDQAYLGPGVGNEVGTGGPSASFNAPPYQQRLTYSNTRSVPDIAAQGGVFPSLPFVFNGRITPVGGTSQSAPMMAAAFGLLSTIERSGKRPALGFANPWLYDVGKRQPETMYDVTIGDVQYAIPLDLEGSTLNIPACCQAELGFDQASGLGVPNFAELRKHTPVRR